MGKKLAIRGHSTRGKEVIELLEMMGGKNTCECTGESTMYSYYVNGQTILNDRLSIIEDDDFEIFTLEEFLEKFPFKVGDKVKNGYGNTLTIKSMWWFEDCETMVYDFKEDVAILVAEYLLKYNNKSSHTQHRHMYLFNQHDIVVIESCDKKQKWICEYKSYVNNQLHFYKGTYDIYSNEEKNKNKLIYDSYYDIASTDTIRSASPGEITLLERMIEKNNTTNHMSNVLAELLEHIKNTSKEDLEKEFKKIEEWSNVGPTVEEFMEFCNKVNKKPKYPTTFKKCRAMLNYNIGSISGYEASLLTSLQNLLVCRNAYWKIAGEEMGLGKPWEPEYKTLVNNNYFTIHTFNNEIAKSGTSHRNTILVFPTEEMRDAFYDNFKNLIEQCKKLL